MAEKTKQDIGQILTLLAEQYRRSKKDNRTNKINRRTQIKPEKIYPAYRRNDADIERIAALNEAARLCEELGFVRIQMNGFSNEISAIVLNDEQIDEAERYLSQQFGYVSKHEKMQFVSNMLQGYAGKSPAVNAVCARLQKALSENRVPAQYEQQMELLKALSFIEANTRFLYLREASMLIYGDSKYLEETSLDAVCRELRNLRKMPCRDNELQDEILQEYHIYREQLRICLKGHFRLKMTNGCLDGAAFPNGIEISAADIENLVCVEIHAARFVTVENKTAYARAQAPDAVFFYLGGYINRGQRDFLQKVARDNPALLFLHFGDIDAGGFYIHEHLCRMTGISFQTWKMSVSELADSCFQSCLLALTANDKSRLRNLREKETYRETVEYMLKHNVKLEQEIVSLYLC